MRPFLIALALTAALGGPAAGNAQGSLEYAVKATYLYKFAPFIEWPAKAFDSPSSPVVLCVAGDDPFGPVLDQAAAGQHIGAHAVVVKRMEKVDRSNPCNILYVSGSKAQPASEALKAVRGTGVLTVTDQARDDRTRGIVDFVVKDNRIRFHIDDEAAAQNGIAISSKLLSLALSVKPRPNP